MKHLTSSLVRWLAVATLCALAGCSEDDQCGAESLSLEVTPAQACLELSATVDTQPGSYKVVGTNNCADPLIVQSPATHDGGASSTFPAGASVTIELDDSEVFNQNAAVKTWSRTAGLGSQLVTITMTKAPC